MGGSFQLLRGALLGRNDLPGGHPSGDQRRCHSGSSRTDSPENAACQFKGVTDDEQHQSSKDGESAADRVEESEHQVAEEGKAEGELEQEEHFGVWCDFMLWSGVVSGSRGATPISSILDMIEFTQERFLVSASIGWTERSIRTAGRRLRSSSDMR